MEPQTSSEDSSRGTNEREAVSRKDESFARLALPWMDDVYRFAFSLTRDSADAQDVVQETYLRAYKSWHTFDQESDCRRWLFTICRNAFLRARQHTKHEVDVSDGDSESAAAMREHKAMMDDGTERLIDSVDLSPAIDRALASLAEPFRSAVQLVDVEDQSYESAAEILGVPIGTVRSRLFRARRQMQQLLRAYAIDAGFRPANAGGRDA